MGYSSGEEEYMLRLTVEGAKMIFKLSGATANRIGAMIYAILTEKYRTKGKVVLGTIMRKGGQAEAFSISSENLKNFAEQAKKYGVMYCLITNKAFDDGLADIIINAEDAHRVNRIIERYGFDRVKMKSYENDIEQLSDLKSVTPENDFATYEISDVFNDLVANVEGVHIDDSPTDVQDVEMFDELMQAVTGLDEPLEVMPKNFPTSALSDKENLSEPISEQPVASVDSSTKKVSVKKTLTEINAARTIKSTEKTALDMSPKAKSKQEDLIK